MIFKIKQVLFITVPIIFIIFFLMMAQFSDTQSYEEKISSYVSEHVYAGPFIFILIYIVHYVFSPVTREFFQITAGYLFGPVSVAYLITGDMIAALIFFLAGLEISQVIEPRFKRHKELAYIHDIIDKKGAIGLLLLRAIPSFPMSFVWVSCGLLKLKKRDFFLMTFLGGLPQIVVLGIFGSSLKGSSLSWIYCISVITMSLGIIFYLLRKKLKAIVVNILSKWH